jgi:hypothetical protein
MGVPQVDINIDTINKDYNMLVEFIKKEAGTSIAGPVAGPVAGAGPASPETPSPIPRPSEPVRMPDWQIDLLDTPV